MSKRDTSANELSSMPARTPEAREKQMINLAIDLAEKQLREGKASSQVITHYLKLGTTKEKIERDILEKQRDLLEAKTEALKSAAKIEELYEDAIKAMREYNGSSEEETDEDVQ